MQRIVKKCTVAQQIALVEECAGSDLTISQYAALKDVSVSTLNNWATKIGISLRKHPRQHSKVNKASKGRESKPIVPVAKTSSAIDTLLGITSESMNQEFSFIDITGCSSGSKPQVSTPQARLEKPLGGLEIRMPNGVQLKVDHIPFETLWLQVVECAKTLGRI